MMGTTQACLERHGAHWRHLDCRRRHFEMQANVTRLLDQHFIRAPGKPAGQASERAEFD